MKLISSSDPETQTDAEIQTVCDWYDLQISFKVIVNVTVR